MLPGGHYNLRLYVAGQTPKSITALANLKKICEEHLVGRYQIEVIDLLEHPQLAAGDQILAVPTLVRRLPEPLKRIIGNLSNMERVLVGLDLRSGCGAMSETADTCACEGSALCVAAVHYRHDVALHRGRSPILRRVCEERLHGEYDLEVIDIYQHPAAAKEYQILAAPTLVKMLPLPLRRIIGDLANEERDSGRSRPRPQRTADALPNEPSVVTQIFRYHS